MDPRKRFIVVGIVLGAVGVAAWPLYAHCGKCAASAKQMVKLMDEGKLSLAQAVETAERHSKGKALAAHCELEEGRLEIAVHCLVDDKIAAVVIDAKTGAVTKMEEEQALPEHAARNQGPGGTVAARVVEAGCGMCIFGMKDVEGCLLAVKIDGKAYLVEGAKIDAHKAGLCSSAKKARVAGRIEGDKFVADVFELQE